MIEDNFGSYVSCTDTLEILAKECKSGKSTVLVLGTVDLSVVARQFVTRNEKRIKVFGSF